MDSTSSTPFCNCHGRQDCLNPSTAIREVSKTSEKDTVNQISLTTTFQMILMMVLNETIRIEVILTARSRTILMLGEKDKEMKEKLYFIFACFVALSVPSICQLHHF